jgi:hypothetical protein
MKRFVALGDAPNSQLRCTRIFYAFPGVLLQFVAKSINRVNRDGETGCSSLLSSIHYDLPGTEADPSEITHRISLLFDGEEWHVFREKKEIMQN